MKNLFTNNVKMHRTRKTSLAVVFALFCLAFLFGCEQNLTLDLPAGQPKLVVEGHIEQNSPPVVVLTRSVPVFSGFKPADIEAAFVHNALVTVSDGRQEFVLQEVNSGQLSPALSRLIAELYGLETDAQTGRLPFTFYFYTNPQLLGQTGRNYQLRVQAEGELLTASTSIPELNPLDSIWIKPHPNVKNDSLVALWYRYRDPDTVGNCIRYFTKRNREPYYPGLINSVFIDDFVSGQDYIDFTLQRGQATGTKLNPDNSGYFRKGDTITVKWCAIDVPQYRFWNSLENELANRGNPFGAPVAIQSNVKGGLGIWGGYGVTYHKIVAPR